MPPSLPAFSMADTILATERLLVHRWREPDWARFRELTNTPACMRWLGGVADDAGWAMFRARIEEYDRRFGHTFWACSRKSDGGHLAGELLGMVGFKRSNAEGQAVFGMLEIGWRLREDAWGYGYAKEAAQACLAFGFETLGAEEIIALTVEGNTASWGLMRALGMEPRPDLEFHDPNWTAELNPTIVHLITSTDWKALAA